MRALAKPNIWDPKSARPGEMNFYLHAGTHPPLLQLNDLTLEVFPTAAAARAASSPDPSNPHHLAHWIWRRPDPFTQRAAVGYGVPRELPV
jgi:hypothetical protein